MHHYIVLLSDLSYQLGLIGLAEYEERCEMADWLSNNGRPDPRRPSLEGNEYHLCDDSVCEDEGTQCHGSTNSTNSTEQDLTEGWLRFELFSKWVFTLGDRDCYPSVPHGHLHRKTNEWPKLNPYTGRFFSGLHDEQVSSRLTKADMKALWNNDDFVEHCRKQVYWYADFSPNYAFPKARFGKFRFPKW